MIVTLRNLASRFTVLMLILFASWSSHAQTTAFSADFSTSTGDFYTTTNGPIGNSATWSMLRSGTDMGARITGGILETTNDATGLFNNSGWVLAYATAGAAPYNSTLNSNPGVVTWTFNMRQVRTNPSGLASGKYGNAVILAGTNNTTATAGSGYAVVLGQSGSIDPLRLVRYTAGLRTSSNIIASNTTGYSDFGANFISVKVTFTPATGTWQLFVRNDDLLLGLLSFLDPSLGTLVSQGTAVNTLSTGTALPLIGAFWNTGLSIGQTAYFDNFKIGVTLPAITSLSPPSKVAGSGQFVLAVNGTNLTAGSVVKWNGTNLVTTYVSPTQLTAVVPASLITAAGTAAITVGNTTTSYSNALTFTIEQANIPSIATSISALNPFTTVTGTASAFQSFTSTGTNLGANTITVTAPTNFEVSLTSGGTYTASVSAPSATTTIYTRVKASAPAGIYNGGTVTLAATGATTKTVAVNATVYAVEPTTSPTLVTFTNTNSISTTVNWTNGNGSNHLVVVREASAVTGLPVDGTSYTASAVFGAGAEVATGQYVAYNGTGNSVTLTGLNPATIYYVAVYDYNGAAGTENYKTTTPATGNKTTLNAPVGLQVTAANTEYKINFDTTVEGVNNGTYNSGGIGTNPQTGELNSNAFAFTGFSDGAVAFGGSSPEDSGSYENGTSDGDVTDGGLYAFQVASGNYALGFQPATGEFSPGSTSFRFQNQTGSAVTSLSVGYKVWVRNNEAGSNSLSFSYSTDNSTYTPVTALTQTTDAAIDAVPGWKAYYKVVTITGLNVASNGYAYLRWTGTPVSGTAYDELAIDDISIVANPTTTFASFAGTAQTFVLAGNSNLAGDVTVLGDTNFVNGKVIVGSNTLTLDGTVTNTVTGGIRGSATSNVVVNGTANPTLSFDQTTVGTTNMLNNLSINTTGGNTTTLGNNLTVSGTLTVDVDQTLNLGTSTLTGALSTIVNNGTVTTQNATTTPFASGKTWGGTGTVVLNAATAAQTLVAGTYNKVTVSTTGGATATGNITLNGDLNLPNANVSATKGSFDTGVYTVTMGPNSANTGVGDVSGTITRNTIVANMQYTFGHPNTHLVIPPVGTLPTSMSLKTTLGVAPTGKTDGILRTYDFIQTGASGTKAIITAHYLDSELNGNTENKLVDWVVQVSPQVVIEQGRTNYDATQNFVELGNVNLAFFSPTFGSKLLTLANSQVATATWNGSVSNSWTTAANWSPNAVPSDATHVIIPDAGTTPNDPILNPLVTIGTLTIEAGGILNSPTGSQFIITGASGAWINNGTFNPSNGTVTFNSNATTNGDATIAGSTTFNNLVIPTGTTLRALANNVLDIAGTFTKTGSFVAGAVNNTVIYSGTNQTVVIPNGAQSAYDNITITGTGAIFPTTLNVNGDITLNSAVSFTGKTILLTGTDNQAIGGTVAPVFNNVTVNKPSGTVMLTSNTTVGGTLTLTSGLLDIDNYNLTLGATPIAGTFSATSMIVAEDAGVVRAPFTSTGSYFFPIGETTSNTSYSPITVNITSASGFSNAYVSVNVKDAKHPDNHSTTSYLTRYWNVTQTGIANAIATITANYIPGDAVGGEATLSAAQLNGAFNVQTNPWLKFNVLSGNTLTATNALLTSGVVSAFTGITAANIVALITGEGDVCQNSSIVLSANITAGDAPYFYFWSNGLGANATAMPPTNVVGSTTYTLTVRDANGILSIDTAVVNVTAAPVGGTLSASQVICANSTPNDVTLTGYTGNIIRWERANTADFAGASTINSTSATLTGAQIGTGITSTKYIRAVVQNGPCDAVYSNTIVISINSTTWDGTSWSDGVPTDGFTAIFTGNYTAAADLYACAVIVKSNANVLIPTGFNAVVTGTVTVTSGTFVVENNAALVQINNVTNVGNVTVKKNSNPLYRLDYTMWSSPVTGQQIGTFSPFTNPSRFYVYGGLNGSNVYADQYFVVPDLTATFQKATGYLIRMPNSITGGPTGTYYAGTTTYSYPGVFTGVPNNGIINKALNTQGGKYTATGNPYPSPLGVYEFFTQNATVLDADSGMYFWRKKNDHTVSSYATLTLAGLVANGATPDANSSTPQDQDYEFGGQDQAIYYQGNNQNWVISPGQGFIVKAAANSGTPQLAFRNNMRKHAPATGGQPFFRTANDSSPSRFWLNLTGADAFSQTAIAYIDGATLGIDYAYDGKRLSDTGNAELYTTVEQSNMAIQARPAFNATDVVPLNFMAVLPGNYQLALDHMDGVFEDGQDIYLVDKLMGVTYNIKESAYNFTTDAGTFTDRFDVIYMKTLGLNNPELAANSVIIYKEGKQLKITSGQMMTGVVAFDLAGRNIYSQKDINANSFSSDPINVAQQVIVVTVTLENGKTVSKKVIFD